MCLIHFPTKSCAPHGCLAVDGGRQTPLFPIQTPLFQFRTHFLDRFENRYDAPIKHVYAFAFKFMVHCQDWFRNYDPHHIETSYCKIQVRTHACALLCDCCSFSQPCSRVLPILTFSLLITLWYSHPAVFQPDMLTSASQPDMRSGCILHLFVLCILLSDRFCYLPSWALPLHSIIMSLSGSVWSPATLRLSSYQCGWTHSPQPLSLLISVSQAHPSHAI